MMIEFLGFLVRIWPFIILWVLGLGADLYLVTHREKLDDREYDEEGWLG